MDNFTTWLAGAAALGAALAGALAAFTNIGKPLGVIASAIAAWFGRWQEPVFWIPGVLALLVGAFYLIPAIDPRSGIDGWGGVWALLTVVLAAFVCGFLAWLFKRWYFLELCDSDERELIDAAAGLDRADPPEPGAVRGRFVGYGCKSWEAVAVLAMDKALWLALFWILLSKALP